MSDIQTLARELIQAFYRSQLLQTLWNAYHLKNKTEGWRLKNGVWSPWFLNLRPLGDEPFLAYRVADALKMLIRSDVSQVTVLVGVEMAGVPIVSAVARAFMESGVEKRYGFTRPLTKKVRTPFEAAQLLAAEDPATYGEKQLVEARLKPGDQVAIVDDMATDLGSKIIARLLVLEQARREGIEVQCSDIVYLLDRGMGTNRAAQEFLTADASLYPGKLHLHYVIDFPRDVPALES
ncbi:MAG: hypothetical protein MN733_41690, partial [Nitrososphaera sp.]|nr:hypothetical protein [Nitrososphaera sp.]